MSKSKSKSKNHLGAVSFAALALTGCSAANEDLTDPLDTAELAPEPPPPLDEFIESARQTTRNGDRLYEEYVLEGDMLVSYEMAVDYYEATYVTSDTVEKGVGVTVPSGGRLPPSFMKYNLNAFFPDISYCFDNTISAAEKPAFATAVTRATGTWAAVSGPLAFRHEATLDGASCTTSNQPLLGFAVRKASGSVSQGSLPGQPNRFLSLASLTDAANILHEVGHIIGLAHEENHTRSETGCAPEQGLPSGGSFADITARADVASIMQSLDSSGRPACEHSLANTRASLSAGDGEAARFLYGN